MSAYHVVWTGTKNGRCAGTFDLLDGGSYVTKTPVLPVNLGSLKTGQSPPKTKVKVKAKVRLCDGCGDRWAQDKGYCRRCLKAGRAA